MSATTCGPSVSDRRQSEQRSGRGETRRIEPGRVVDISLASRPYACVRLEIVVVVFWWWSWPVADNLLACGGNKDDEDDDGAYDHDDDNDDDDYDDDDDDDDEGCAR